MKDRRLEIIFFNQNYMTKKSVIFENQAHFRQIKKDKKLPDELLLYHAQSLFEDRGHFTQFPNKNSKTKIIEYAVQPEDTIYGLEFKFNLLGRSQHQKFLTFNKYSMHVIKNMNFLFDDALFPGQVLSIPVQETVKKEGFKLEDFDVTNDEDFIELTSSSVPEETLEGSRLEDFSLINKNNNAQQQEKEGSQKEGKSKFQYEFFYCTSHADIPGLLRFDEFGIYFEPLATFENKVVSMESKRFLKFHADIDFDDITDFFPISLPSKYCENYSEEKKNFTKDFFLQVNLYRVGDHDIEEQYAKRLAEMREEKKAFATLFFKVYDKNFDMELTNDQKFKVVNEAANNLQLMCKLGSAKRAKEINKHGTHVPFFDIIYDSLFSNTKRNKSFEIKNVHFYGISKSGEKRKKKKTTEKEKSSKIPIIPEDDPYEEFKLFRETSSIVETKHIKQIISFIPPIFKLRKWKLLYSINKNGININTLFRNCENSGANILIIKDWNENVFGAYTSECWQKSGSFYGTGESFLFTFKKSKSITPYFWSGKNNYFQLSDSDGLSIGAEGPDDKYGIFIDSEFYKGYSSPCDTFDNQVLTEEEKKEFLIKELEVIY